MTAKDPKCECGHDLTCVDEIEVPTAADLSKRDHMKAYVCKGCGGHAFSPRPGELQCAKASEGATYKECPDRLKKSINQTRVALGLVKPGK